jgi:hypothetical protein
MLTSRPAPLTANRPLHVKTPGKALQKARGILQENALQGLRTVKTQKVPLQLQSPHEGGSPTSTDCHLLLNYHLIEAIKSLGSRLRMRNQRKASKFIARPLGDKTPFTNRQRRSDT